MKGGAWPFLVGGVICLVNSDNERDLNLLNSHGKGLGSFGFPFSLDRLDFLEGQSVLSAEGSLRQ
jgi:hypothetical protein